jgi:hypothetical protein
MFRLSDFVGHRKPQFVRQQLFSIAKVIVIRKITLFFELFAFSGFFGSIFKLKSRFFPAKTSLNFLKTDASYATLSFIKISALEFIYKAGKIKWEFPDIFLRRRRSQGRLQSYKAI